MNRAAALFTLTLAACFDPTFENPTCGPHGECPSGFTCEQTVCREMVTDIDATGGSDAIDAPIDAPSDGLTDAPPTDGVVQCPGGEIQSPLDPHRCYYKLTTQVTWPNARTQCQAGGGDLATILSQSENLVIQPFYQGENQGLWLGATDMMIEMDWRWVDGQPPPYFEWAAGEPNDQPLPGDCMRIDASGSWFDTNCNENRRALCLHRI